jgi:hypothetical protein
MISQSVVASQVGSGLVAFTLTLTLFLKGEGIGSAFTDD